jgi:membrane-associated phospholipid phosphatase
MTTAVDRTPGHLPILILLSVLLLGAGPTLRAAALTDSLPHASGPVLGDTIWSDMRTFVNDGVTLFGRPGSFDARDWATAGGVIVADAGLMSLDEKVRAQTPRWHSSGADKVAQIFNDLGTPYPHIAIAVPLYATGLLADAPALRLAGLHVAQSLVYAAVINVTAKCLFGRERPALGHGAFTFHGPSTRDNYNSLPSGHTTAAFALCSTLAAEIDNPWATAGLYSAAALTGVARMYFDRHWLSDTFLGAAIGTACGYGVVHLHDQVEMGHASLRIAPSLGGLTAVLIF